MVYYCTTSDVGSRLGLDSAQRTRANTKLTSAIRRSTIDIDGDSFVWTGKSTNTLTGVSGLTFDHADDVTVQEGEFAHVLREICADIAASYYLEDESMFQTTGPEGSLRGTVLRERGEMNLKRLAHLGSVD